MTLPITFANLPSGFNPMSLFDQQFAAMQDGANLNPGSVPDSALVDSGATAGSYGSASVVPVFTVNNKGLLTSVSSTAILVSLSTNVTGTLPIANGGWNATNVGSGRLNYSLPVYVATRTALKALDKTKDKVAFLTEAGRAGVFELVSGSANTDPEEGVYITAADGGVWKRVFEQLDITMFGAVADGVGAVGTDNSTAIQAAITYAQSYNLSLRVPGAPLHYNYATAPTVSDILVMFGDGADNSVLASTSAFSGFVIDPSTSVSLNNTFYSFTDFSIVPSASGGGTYGVYSQLTGAEFLSNMLFRRMRIGDFGTASLFLNNASAIANGYFTSVFSENFLGNGILGVNVGDSILFEKNTINGQGSINITQITGARQLVFRDNNITLRGGALFTNCPAIHFETNWVELPTYLGNYNGVSAGLVTFDNCPALTCQNNTIQPLASISTSSDYALVLGTNCDGTLIDGNQFGTGEIDFLNLGSAPDVIVRESNFDIAGGTLGIVGLAPTGKNFLVGTTVIEQISVLVNDFTGTNVNTAQPVFTAAQDTVSLASITTYEFEASYQIDTTGTTSHSLGVLFDGTATIGSIAYSAIATNGAASGTASAPLMARGAAATLQTLTAAVASATQNTIWMRGVVRVTVAGTLIPQFQYSAAPGVAPVVRANSFFRIWPIGSSSVATVGAWS